MRRKKRQRSFGEFYISEILNKYNIKFEKEKKFKNCLSFKKYPLRFDFYLNDYNILIEFQGMHHYKPVNKYYRAKKVHLQTVINDNIKKEFCKNNNIYLIEISYLDIKNIEEILKKEITLIIDKNN